MKYNSTPLHFNLHWNWSVLMPCIHLQDTFVLHIEILLNFAYKEIASVKLNDAMIYNFWIYFSSIIFIIKGVWLYQYIDSIDFNSAGWKSAFLGLGHLMTYPDRMDISIFCPFKVNCFLVTIDFKQKRRVSWLFFAYNETFAVNLTESTLMPCFCIGQCLSNSHREFLCSVSFVPVASETEVCVQWLCLTSFPVLSCSLFSKLN